MECLRLVLVISLARLCKLRVLCGPILCSTPVPSHPWVWASGTRQSRLSAVWGCWTAGGDREPLLQQLLLRHAHRIRRSGFRHPFALPAKWITENEARDPTYNVHPCPVVFVRLGRVAGRMCRSNVILHQHPPLLAKGFPLSLYAIVNKN